MDRFGEIARRLGVPEEGVALARETVVQLHDGAPQVGLPALEIDECGLDVVVVAQVLEAVGNCDAGLAKDLSPP